MLKKVILGQVRHLLSMGGSGFFGYLISIGVSPDDALAIGSGVVALLSAAWSAYDKYKEEKKKEVANA